MKKQTNKQAMAERLATLERLGVVVKASATLNRVLKIAVIGATAIEPVGALAGKPRKKKQQVRVIGPVM